MKSCSCGITGKDNFYRDSSTKDGLRFYCKACVAKQRRETYRRKYPKGRNGGNAARFSAMAGNQRALKHGRYVGMWRKRSSPQTLHILDYIIRVPIA